MYKIKEKPEDFIVKEISNVEVKDKGRYAYLNLKKTNYTTLKAVETISFLLHIPLKKLGYAGNKDKQAITEQLISLPSEKANKALNLKLKDIELTLKGYGDSPISLGDLKANNFLITVRNLTKKQLQNIPEHPEVSNFFGEQRFGKNNVEIGRAIIKKEFRKAIELIIKTNEKQDEIKEFLKQRKNEYIGALRLLNPKLLKLYIHSYQSYIFNKTLEEYIKLKKQVKKLPIIGFGTETDDPIIKDMMKKEKISFRDFIIREIPELSSEGDYREAFIAIKDFKVIEKSKNKVKLEFTLPKGSYATEVIKQLYQRSSKADP